MALRDQFRQAVVQDDSGLLQALAGQTELPTRLQQGVGIAQQLLQRALQPGDLFRGLRQLGNRRRQQALEAHRLGHPVQFRAQAGPDARCCLTQIGELSQLALQLLALSEQAQFRLQPGPALAVGNQFVLALQAPLVRHRPAGFLIGDCRRQRLRIGLQTGP
ncbi:hypothetical protein D9M71_232790 [compost metagenome]